MVSCEHKYWSRLIQREVAPEATPDFCAVDPFGENPWLQITLDPPFWFKPVKACGSQLGFHVRSLAEFDVALVEMRGSVGKFSEPFLWFLEKLDLPDAVRDIDGSWCLCEEVLESCCSTWSSMPASHSQEWR